MIVIEKCRKYAVPLEWKQYLLYLVKSNKYQILLLKFMCRSFDWIRSSLKMEILAKD